MVTLAGMHVNISYYLNEPECGCNVRTCFVLGPFPRPLPITRRPCVRPPTFSFADLILLPPSLSSSPLRATWTRTDSRTLDMPAPREEICNEWRGGKEEDDDFSWCTYLGSVAYLVHE